MLPLGVSIKSIKRITVFTGKINVQKKLSTVKIHVIQYITFKVESCADLKGHIIEKCAKYSEGYAGLTVLI